MTTMATTETEHQKQAALRHEAKLAFWGNCLEECSVGNVQGFVWGKFSGEGIFMEKMSVGNCPGWVSESPCRITLQVSTCSSGDLGLRG